MDGDPERQKGVGRHPVLLQKFGLVPDKVAEAAREQSARNRP